MTGNYYSNAYRLPRLFRGLTCGYATIHYGRRVMSNSDSHELLPTTSSRLANLLHPRNLAPTLLSQSSSGKLRKNPGVVRRREES